MGLPIPPIQPNQPIPNNPFYYPETNYLAGEYGPFIVGSGLSISQSGIISVIGGGTGVASITAGSGIFVNNATGNVTVTNVGVTGLTAGTGITLSGSTGNVTISAAAAGSVTSIVTTGGIQGGPITTSGIISLTNTGVVAGSYSNPSITVDVKGRITTISNGTSVASVTGSLPIQSSGGPNPVISIQAASTTAAGAVQLSDSVSNTSSTQAATSLAVKTAFDAAAGAVPKSCFAAKGTLVVGAGPGTPVALPVGANNLVLTADSSAPNGVKWALSSGVESLTGCLPVVIDEVSAGNFVACVNQATTSAAGVVQLVDSLSSTSTSQALSANQGRALQLQLSAVALAIDPTLAGTFNPATGLVVAVTTAGASAGYTPGGPLPAPAAGNANHFVVAIGTGNYTPPGGGGPYAVTQGDWMLSNGGTYTFLDVGYNAPAASDTTPGIVRLATPAEAAAGTDNTIALSPATAKATYIACSALPSKGAILTATATSNPAALPVGADNQILVACSFCPTGLTWIANPGGGVTSITAGSGLTGGTITTSGTIALDAACVLAPSLLSGQGALITQDNTSTPTALPLGADGYILSVNVTCASGLEWIPNTGGGGGGTGTVTAITAGNGLLGGTITSFGTITLDTSCVVQPSTFIAKGTLAAGTAPGTPGALAVGTDGQVLTADSATPTGLAWTTPTTGTVTSVDTSAALTGGPITTSGTLDLATTSVTAGTYAYPTTISVDACGRLLNAAAGTPPLTGLSGTLPISVTAGQSPVISISAASTTGSGAVQLSDTVSSTATNLALTANQGRILQNQIAALSFASNVVLAGTFDATTSQMLTVTIAGAGAGFSIGSDLPAPAPGNVDYYVIVTTGGSYNPPGGGSYLTNQGDWLLSDGTVYQFLNIGADVVGASVGTPGIVALASTAETETGTDGTIAVTPAGGKATYVSCSNYTNKGSLLVSTAANTPSALPLGASGQVLTVDLACATGVKWASSDAIPCACITAKGSLITGTGASAPVALPVGLNGQVLVADSTCTEGLKWQAITQCLGTVTSVGTSAAFTGGPITTTGTLDLAPTGVGAATYAYPSSIAVDACGRVISLVAGSQPISPSIFVKGAILVGTGNGSFTALPAGANGQVLAVDAACASGLTWVTGGGGGGTGTVTSVSAGTGLTGGTITTSGTIALADTPVTPGSYTLGNFTVDAQGRITAASNGSAVTSVTTGTGLTGGTITSTGTIALANTTVTPGTYSLANIAVDAQGRITTASNGVAVTSVTAGDGLLGGTITTSGTIELNTSCLISPGIFTQQAQIITSLAAGSPNVLEPGTNGQILAINTAVPNGISWIEDCGRTAIPCGCIIGKGGLITGSGSSAPVALPVGANGHVLYADSSCTAGLTWGALPETIPCACITGKGAIITGSSPGAVNTLNVGANGQVLTANSSAPNGLIWEDPAGVQSVSGIAPLVVDNTDAQNPIFSVDAASTLAPGVVQLEDSVTSTSTTLALTANQGKILQDQINSLVSAGGLILAGTYDAASDQLATVSTDGASAGFLVGSPLPAPGVAVDNYFVIITVPGTFTPTGTVTPITATNGDWVLADTTNWQLLDIGPEVSAASTTTAGIVRLATDAETQTGTDGTIAVTPVGAKATYVGCAAYTAKGTLLAATGAGIPAALPVGANNFVLTADSACGTGMKWAVNAAIPCACITAKGAILSGTGASVPSALPVGANNQVLIACNITSTGLCWITLDYISCTQITGKGALITGTAACAAAPLAVGANGQVLMADSACGTGLKWASITQCQGTVTSIAAGAGLTGGTITGTGTIALNPACVIAPTAFTGKGVLLSASAASTPTALTPGASGTFLTVDATEPTGLRWVAITQCPGTVTSVVAGTGLTGGTITGSGTIALNPACVIAPAAFTAKGNLLVSTAASNPTALAVGANGFVLTADSACATGVKWAPASGGVTALVGVSPVVIDDTNPSIPSISVDAATTGAPGIVQLSDTVTSTSATQAATASAVKVAYDAAVAAQATADDAIPEAAFTAYGDILVGSSPGSNVAVSVGADGTVLTADSNTAAGVKWEAPALPAAIGTAPITVDNTDPLVPVIGVNAASTTAAGVVQLNDTVTSTSITEALTANQGRLLQEQINSLVTGGGLTLAGTFNATTSQMVSVTANGGGAGFVVGSNLPAPAAGNTDYFVIVTTGGSYSPPGGGGPFTATQGDWFVSNGTTYQFLDVGPSTPSASTTTAGIVRLATNAEAQTGTNANIALTPANGEAVYLKRSELTAKGAIITASAAGTPSTLAVGVNGRVLTACSTCPNGLTWTAQSVGIPTTCITGKGALISGSASNTPVALPVGANGQVLTADSACPTGLKWATSAASAGIPCSLLTQKATLVAGCASGIPVTVDPPQVDGQILWSCNFCPGGMTWRCASGIGVASPASLGTVYGMLGCESAGYGFRALDNNRQSFNNVAIGRDAANYTGGASNIAVGAYSMFCLPSGSGNVAIGNAAIGNACCGTYENNIAIGNNAGCKGFGTGDTFGNGCSNIVIGTGAAECVPFPSGFTDNIVIGTNAGNKFVGASTIVIGNGAGSFGTVTQNIGSGVLIGPGIKFPDDFNAGQLALGYRGLGCTTSLYWLTGCGDGSIRPGYGIRDSAGNLGTVGQVLTATGSNSVQWCAVPSGGSLATPTVFGSVYGCTTTSHNAYLGYQVGSPGGTENFVSGCCAASCGITTGSHNIVVGGIAGQNLTTGTGNVFLGRQAGACTTSGFCNVAIGGFALQRNLTSGDQVAIGTCALGGNVFGDCNIAIGRQAGCAMSCGNNNILLGSWAGCSLGTPVGNIANANIFIGCSAGRAMTAAASNNVIIGPITSLSTTTTSCELALGFGDNNCWLTGCSNKNIRPGAGILDCAGNAGTAGQVLTSTGTAIQWASPSATREYMFATMGADITNASSIYDINRWCTIRNSVISISNCTCFNLTGGRVYQLTWSMGMLAGTNESMAMSPNIACASNNEIITGYVPETRWQSNSGNISSTSTFSTILAPTANIAIKVRMSGGGGFTYTVCGNRSFMTIAEL